jgi:hypothetical protein
MVGIEYGSSSAVQFGDSGGHDASRGGTGGANSGAGADEQRREAAAERAAGGRDAAEWRAERGGTCVAALQLLSDRAQASQRVLAGPCVCHGVCAWLGRC